MRKNYGGECKLLFTDTDSLFYEIKTNDLNGDLEKIKDQMDFSDYPEEHPLHDVSNKKVIGKFKDECNSLPISEFVGIKSKMYSFIVNNKNKKRLKGVKTSVVNNEIKHSDYLKCIEDDSITMLTNRE